jgi:hypothetical protein
MKSPQCHRFLPSRTTHLRAFVADTFIVPATSRILITISSMPRSKSLHANGILRARSASSLCVGMEYSRYALGRQALRRQRTTTCVSTEFACPAMGESTNYLSSSMRGSSTQRVRERALRTYVQPCWQRARRSAPLETVGGGASPDGGLAAGSLEHRRARVRLPHDVGDRGARSGLRCPASVAAAAAVRRHGPVHVGAHAPAPGSMGPRTVRSMPPSLRFATAPRVVYSPPDRPFAMRVLPTCS